jgi:hypothetical protein
MILSMAGVALALVVAWANLRPWWKGGRDPKALIPYGTALLLGLLATMCIGGLLGWGAAGIAGLITSGGNKVVSAAAGTGAAPVATSRLGALTPAGGVVVTAYFIGVYLMWKGAAKLDKRRMAGGLLAGAVLGFLPGIVQLMGWLPNTVNDAGAYVQAFVEGRVSV